MLRTAAVFTLGAMLWLPAQVHAQLGGGVGGVGLQGLSGAGQFGAPPAGVGLHQQYMQLYGLPVNFTQGATNNGGAQGIFPGYGGYGGGLGGRFYGVNYQRQRMAAQYLQMLRFQQQQQMYYSQNAYNAYPTQPTAGTSAAPSVGFGMSQGNTYQQPFFSTTPTSANTQFRGFGLASTIGTPLPALSTSQEKKDQEQKDKEQDKK
jgi:hypothetical protein